MLFQSRNVFVVSRAKDLIRNAAKRALGQDEDDTLIPKRLALQDDEPLQIRNFMKIFGKFFKYTT